MKSLDSTRWRSAVLYLILFFVLILPPQVQAQGPVVQILLFYSDTCPHCHEVMENVLPPLQAKYGSRLQVRALEISDAKSFEILLQLEAAYQVPEEKVGIPEIFIGSEYLIGSVLIDEKLDGLIEAYLAQGGVKYPTVEGASTPADALVDATPSPAPAANATGEAAVPAAPAPLVSFYVFWDSKCGPCLKLINEVLPDILSRYPKEQVFVDARNLEHGSYTLMRDLETQRGLEMGTMPEVFIGNEVLLGLDEIQDRLPSLLDQYLASGGIDLPQLEVQPSISAVPASPENPESEQAKTIHLAYFFQVGCRECDRAELDLKFLQQIYPQLQVEKFDSRENATLLEELGIRAGVLESRRLLAPAIFVGNDSLVREEVNARRLEALIGEYLAIGAPAVWTEDAVPELRAASGIMERFRSFGVLTVAVAGLIDGLNPCAFATVVFFISYLAFIGRRGKEILVVGLAFTLGVFLTYLGVGFGFLKAVAALPILAQLGPLAVWLDRRAVFRSGRIQPARFLAGATGKTRRHAAEIAYLSAKAHQSGHPGGSRSQGIHTGRFRHRCGHLPHRAGLYRADLFAGHHVCVECPGNADPGCVLSASV